MSQLRGLAPLVEVPQEQEMLCPSTDISFQCWDPLTLNKSEDKVEHLYYN